MITSALDLPVLVKQPDAETLLQILKALEPKKIKNFSDGDPSEELPIDGLFSWLTYVIASPLDWLDADDAENIRSLASKRMAERCGRTAAPTLTRSVEIDGIDPIELVEPSLTADNLGLKTWGSSFVLSQRLVREKDKLVLHDPVIELGAGTGLCGIVAGRLGYNVTLTDLPEIVDNLKVNATNNLSRTEYSVEVLDWTVPETFAGRKFNSLIVSDPIYSPEHPKWLKQAIDVVLSDSGQLLLQLPLRDKYQDVRDKLYKLLETDLERIYLEDQAGSDDFGETQYTFSIWKRK